MTDYKQSSIDGTIVRDFATRTLANLKFIEQHYQRFRDGKSEVEVYEVTQLINSMLGLLIFPKETFWEHLREIPLSQIPDCPFKPHPQAPDLRGLIRLIRNSFSHFNLKIKANTDYIYAIELSNKNGKGVVTWRDTITVFELRKFIEYFITGIIDSSLLTMPIEKIA